MTKGRKPAGVASVVGFSCGSMWQLCLFDQLEACRTPDTIFGPIGTGTWVNAMYLARIAENGGYRIFGRAERDVCR